MTLLLDAKEVVACTVIDAIVEAVEAGVREEVAGEAVFPPRLNLPTPNGFFRVMPAVLGKSGVMGFKVFNGSVERGVRYVIAIYDAVEGSLLALLDAAYLTAARTGATTGVATRYLARPESQSVGVIGSGLEARTNLAAVCAVRPIRRARVYSPTPAHRERFAREQGEALQIEIEVAPDPESAVSGVDIVVVATNTSGRDDLVAYRGAWMEPGQHVNSIGSTGGPLREIDPDTFRRAHRIGMDSVVQVEEESADAVAAREAGAYPEDRIVALADLVAAGRVARGPDEITLFKSVGTAVQDVMAGYAVYREAVRLGRGRELGEFLEHKQF